MLQAFACKRSLSQPQQNRFARKPIPTVQCSGFCISRVACCVKRDAAAERPQKRRYRSNAFSSSSGKARLTNLPQQFAGFCLLLVITFGDHFIKDILGALGITHVDIRLGQIKLGGVLVGFTQEIKVVLIR